MKPDHAPNTRKKVALAERAPTPLHDVRLKHGPQQPVPSVRLVGQVQPDKIVLLKPCRQAGPVEDQA